MSQQATSYFVVYGVENQVGEVYQPNAFEVKLKKSVRITFLMILVDVG